MILVGLWYGELKLIMFNFLKFFYIVLFKLEIDGMEVKSFFGENFISKVIFFWLFDVFR